MKTKNIITAYILLNLTASSQETGNFSAGEKRNNFFAGTNNFFAATNNFFPGFHNNSRAPP